MSQSFQYVVEDHIAIEAEINEIQFDDLRKEFRSWLYICADSGSECALRGGFATISANVEYKHHIPVNLSSLTFELGVRLIEILSSMPEPIIIQCPTSIRASAVAMLYWSNQNRWDAEGTSKFAFEKSLPYLGNPKLVHWVASVVTRLQLQSSPPLIFRQLACPQTGTFTYIIGDPGSSTAVVVDPTAFCCDRDTRLLSELNLTPLYILCTDTQEDQLAGAHELKINFPSSTVAYGGRLRERSCEGDLHLDKGSKVRFGKRYLIAEPTPGRSANATCYIFDDRTHVFTGETFLVRGIGGINLPDSDGDLLYVSLQKSLLSLPNDTIILPKHPTDGIGLSTVLEEKLHNPLVSLPKCDFLDALSSNLQQKG